MKPVLCFVMVLVVFAGLAVALVSPLKAQRTKCARYRAGQSPEGSALLAHEWARAHALPGR